MQTDAMTNDATEESSSHSLLDEFGRVTVLIVGDVMLDEYVWGDVSRISPEAPVPVVEFRSRTHSLGGAANAAANIVSLAGRALLGGFAGEDVEGQALRRELGTAGIEAHIVTDDARPTTTKTRLIGGSQQVLRVDREQRSPLGPDGEVSVLRWASEHLASVDCLLISDYGKGVVTAQMCTSLIELARQIDAPVVVDPKGRDFAKYRGATVVTPNALELRSAVEPLRLTVGEMKDDAMILESVLGGAALIVTRGAEGATLFEPGNPPVHIPARPRRVFDVTGAGDTFVATLALAVGAGAALADAASVANEASGIVVGKVGTGVVDMDELRTALDPSSAEMRPRPSSSSP
jgi:rfaE bifunctional protein kinase chain/domain